MKFKKEKITGVILAGGKNSRFGDEKALVEINGVKIIEKIIAAMRDVFSENIIIANNETFYNKFDLKLFPDIVKGKGPLMGIYTALKSTSSNIFVTASDMPFVKADLIREIVGSLKTFDAAIPKYNDKFHFLHAAYSSNCISLIKKNLDNNNLGLKYLVKDLNCNIIENFKFEDGLLSPFFNMNRPADLDLIKKQIKT